MEEDGSSLEGNDLATAARHVRFCEQVTVIKDNAPSAQELQDCWYTRPEFACFHRDTASLAQQIVLEEQNQLGTQATSSACTVHILSKAYRGFCRVHTSADIAALWHQLPPARFLDATRVGLDRWLVPDIARDKVERRKRIVRQVTAIQRLFNKHGDTPPPPQQQQQQKQQGAATIRQVSRSISQPSRLYSHYVAQLAARTTDATATR